MDNIFLVRHVIDMCKCYNVDCGILSLDQEKAFDRVDHTFVFNTLFSPIPNASTQHLVLVMGLWLGLVCYIEGHNVW